MKYLSRIRQKKVYAILAGWLDDTLGEYSDDTPQAWHFLLDEPDGQTWTLGLIGTSQAAPGWIANPGYASPHKLVFDRGRELSTRTEFQAYAFGLMNNYLEKGPHSQTLLAAEELTLGFLLGKAQPLHRPAE